MQPDTCVCEAWSWLILAAAILAGGIVGWIAAHRVIVYNDQSEFEAGYQAALEDSQREAPHVV